MEIPPLLLGGFEPAMNEFTAALRRCSSSIDWFLLRRMNQKPKPRRARITATPTDTPTAMATTLGPPSSSSSSPSWAPWLSVGVSVADAEVDVERLPPVAVDVADVVVEDDSSSSL